VVALNEETPSADEMFKLMDECEGINITTSLTAHHVRYGELIYYLIYIALINLIFSCPNNTLRYFLIQCTVHVGYTFEQCFKIHVGK